MPPTNYLEEKRHATNAEAAGNAQCLGKRHRNEIKEKRKGKSGESPDLFKKR